MSFEQNDAPFIAPPPPSPLEGNPLYPPHVLQTKADEAKSDAKTALILSILGIFCFGFILGIIAYKKAENALEIISIYEVAKDSRSLATTAKVLAIVDIVLWVVGILARFLLK